MACLSPFWRSSLGCRWADKYWAASTAVLFKTFPGEEREAQVSTSEAPRRRRVTRRRIPESFWERAAYSFILILVIELVGTVGMHAIEGWSYLDSFYFTSFIATGQGPPGNLLPASESGKVFSSVLAFVSVGTVITALLFLFGPFLGSVIKEGEEKVKEFEEEVGELEHR
jgi:uncharacterized oligopeptide transporter (OPT) family protein